MKGGRSAGLKLGAVSASILMTVILCGCAGVGREAIQKEVPSLPETTNTYPSTAPGITSPVSSLPKEELVVSSPGTTSTLIDKTSDKNPLCEADCISNTNPQIKDLCLRAYANSCLDESICKDIQPGEDRDGCYYDFAGKTGDILQCETIPGNNTKALCKAGYNKDPSVCREITNADMQCDCYLSVIMPSRNMSQCENVLPVACKERCFYEYAVKYDVPDLCQKAENGSMDSCYQRVAEENLDPFACAGVRIQSADLCYLDMVVGLSDPLLCDNITYSEKDYKYWCQAASGRNVSLCDRVGKDKWLDCIYYLARLTGDESICEKTNDKTGSCYIALAEYGKSPSYCENIQSQEKKDRCYASSAASRSDISLCKKIVDQNYKKECYLSFMEYSAKEMLLGGKSRVFS
jgi:hypothetical protein